jgi:hypothetical protein
MIWKRRLTLDELNATSARTLVGHLGIVYTRLVMMCWKPKCRWMPAPISRLACCTAGRLPRWRKRLAQWPAF